MKLSASELHKYRNMITPNVLPVEPLAYCMEEDIRDDLHRIQGTIAAILAGDMMGQEEVLMQLQNQMAEIVKDAAALKRLRNSRI